MSTVASQIDAKQVLVDMIRRMGSTYLNDISHIPEEHFVKSPGGVARSPLSFTAEVIGFNGLATRVALGGEMAVPDAEARQRFYDSVDSYGKARTMLEKGVEDLASAVESASEETLSKTVTAPWGAPMSVYQLCMAAATHMGYHDGQINYLQTLLGDAENHWM